ncbi:type II secretion system protein [Nocardioides marmoriginsengisoli]|uniref:Type II secretion system protein n=1 Tax=Nocardioides marmoriginsengisoli TaxID=661483 RepID=A0A3N0CFE4_9ACTN|nr:type II secretion system protein [Nocardioides marmoriginsengisoli]RNL62187.1 type II secretion system protein [Nocardioides marmoriginsengisoli]
MTTRLLAAVGFGVALLMLTRPRSPLPPSRRALTVGAVVALGVGGAVLVVALKLPVVTVALAGAASMVATREAGRRRARSIAARRRDAAISACSGLAADLQAGRTPTAALAAIAVEWDEFGEVASAGQIGADVPAALRRLADEPGAGSLRWVAASWTVAHRSGAGLAGAVDLAAAAMLDERATLAVLDTELASARATARLLAVLPLGVLLLGQGVGGDPFGFLFGSVVGTGCLVAGLLLAWVGLAWIERIADGIRSA